MAHGGDAGAERGKGGTAGPGSRVAEGILPQRIAARAEEEMDRRREKCVKSPGGAYAKEIVVIGLSSSKAHLPWCCAIEVIEITQRVNPRIIRRWRRRVIHLVPETKKEVRGFAASHSLWYVSL